MLSAGKYLTDAKRGKTFNRSQARVKIKQGQRGKTVDWLIHNDVMTLLSIHVPAGFSALSLTGVKRGKTAN